MQNLVKSNKHSTRLSAVLFLTLCVITLSLVSLLCLPELASAQVSISLSAQETYDDNVFLEEGTRLPSFVIVDDQFETDFNDNQAPTILSDELDGEEDSDLITNLSISIAGASPYLTNYMENNLQLGVGFLIFADYSEQNRLTLDGVLDTRVAKAILPSPYYINISNTFRSNASDNVGNAEGTATRATQTYELGWGLGVANVSLLNNLSWGLGYTGTYHLFLGELRFEEASPNEVEEEGSDYHAHSLGTNFDYQVTPTFSVGLSGDAGVQLFTNVETNDVDRETRDADDLDRTNYNARFRMRYAPDNKFSATGFIGASLSSYMETPQPVEVTTVDENGDSQTVTVQRDEDETSLIFGGELGYSFEPGTQIVAGVDQNVGTDIDGDRITTRSVYANGAFAIGDQLSLTLTGRFLEFSSSDELDQATERLELGASFGYLLTQNISLLMGYNFVDQNNDDPLAESSAFTRSQDYKVNRFYIGITGGIIGLPG